MSRKHKKVCTTPTYIEHFLILASTTTGYIINSAFASLLGIPIGITSSAIGLKICLITARIKTYKSIYNIIVLSAKSKLNSMEILVSRALIDSVISHDEFVLIKYVLK